MEQLMSYTICDISSITTDLFRNEIDFLSKDLCDVDLVVLYMMVEMLKGVIDVLERQYNRT